MRNGKNILLLICVLSLTFALGIFVGRNINSEYKELPNNTTQTIPTEESTKSYKLDINTATKSQLMELPGIGEVIAERIIAFRTSNGPFIAVDELLNVEGIGNMKLQQIEIYICVGG